MCYTLTEIKAKTVPIAIKYGISKMSLFGSYARGEALDTSDVDIIVERGKLKSLIGYNAFVNELEASLNCHVDVVTTGIRDKEFLAAIKKDEVLLYEG